MRANLEIKFSDLDLFLITENAEAWLYGDMPEKLGSIKISFVEPTLGGGKERRMFFDNYRDVDMIVLTRDQMQGAINQGIANWVMNRGYNVLYDNMGVTDMLQKNIVSEIHTPDISSEEFVNVVNDFYFHVIWASKKLLRGELWSGKMCIDGYLKNHLLHIMECYTATKYNKDTWHDGRFLDRWADVSIQEELKNCFALYNANDARRALHATLCLFARLAKELAEMKGYSYPQAAEAYAREYIFEY